MRKLITGLFVVLSTGLFAQTRPNNFTELPTVDNTNFEVYSQKNGLPRRASLETLKRYFDQALTFANDTLSLSGIDGGQKIYLPTGVSAINDLSDGYTEGTNNLFLGREPFDGYTGGNNIIITKNGADSLRLPDDYGAGMIVIGSNAYDKSLKGSAGSTIVGNYAVGNSTGSEIITAFGEYAGFNSMSSNDTYIGQRAGFNMTGVNRFNTFVGAQSGQSVSSGNWNTFLGAFTRGVPGDNQIVIGAGGGGVYPEINLSKGVNSAKIGNIYIDSTFLFGNINLYEYGSANKEASDLGKTGSGYFLEVATDGTLVETSISGAISNTFQQVVSSNSFDTIHVVAKPGAVSLATSNSRANYDLSVSSLADVRTISIVMDLTVGTRQTQTIIKVDDASNESNVSLGTLMLPSITVYDAAPTLLDVNEVYNVTETLTNGDLPYKITFNNDGTYNIVFGQGDWGSKSRVVVTINF